MTDMFNYEKKQDEQTMINTDIGKRKKEQYIENLREGDVINDIFAINIKNPPRNYRKGTMFGFIVSDKTGKINVKYWGGENKDRVKRLYESFKIGDVVQIRLGNVEVYQDKLQISINENTGGIRRCNPNEYDKSDFIATLSENRINKFIKEIKECIDEMENKQLKILLKSFFDDSEFLKLYANSPSAMTHHHNYIGGNIEHAVGVLRLCKTMYNMYPGINHDLLITGAILHDVGKIKEYKITSSIDKTDEGNFIGHIVIGDRWIREKISELRKKKMDFDKNLENYLCHMILSHHGKYEYGSPKMPKIIEANILFQADLMDSQVKNYIQNLEEYKNNSDEDWAFIWDSDYGGKRPIFIGETS